MLAFRKVNGMARKENATGGIFKKLAKGKGGFNLKHPGAGKHVEADLSRQVMVLAKGGEVDEIYHDLLGRSGDSDDPRQLPLLPQGRGLQQPRDVLLGLLHPRLRDPRLPLACPTYPASHGCLRNPIPDSVHIYNWIDIGDPSTSTASRLDCERPRDAVAELREHALVLGEVTLSSGATASYYVDAKRAILRQPAFGALGELVAAEAVERGATAVGGMTMGADPIASAAISDPAGRDLLAFFVRKEKKQHGLQRWVEGPLLEDGHAGADRRGRRHHRRLDGEGDRALPRGGPARSSARSRSSTAWPAAPRAIIEASAAPPTLPWQRSTTSTPIETTASRRDGSRRRDPVRRAAQRNRTPIAPRERTAMRPSTACRCL